MSKKYLLNLLLLLIVNMECVSQQQNTTNDNCQEILAYNVHFDQTKSNKPSVLRNLGFTNVYVIESDRDTILEICESLSVIISPKSFAHNDGSPVIGDIELGVNIYEDLATMYQAGLATNFSDSVNLESLVMFRIEAMSNGKFLDLLKDIRLEYRLPATGKDVGQYGLYYSENGRQWQAADTSERLSSKSYLALRSRSLNTGFVFEQIVPNYLVQYDKLYLGYSYTFTNEYNLVKKELISIGDLSKGKISATRLQNEKQVISDVNMIITDSIFVLTEILHAYPADIWFKNTDNVQIREVFFLSISPLQTLEMVSFVNRLGYINIDKFIRAENLVDFVVSSSHITPDADVRLFFENRRAILKGEQTAGKIVFKSIPKGEKVWIAITKQGNETELGYVFEETISQEHYEIQTELIYADKSLTMKRVSDMVAEIFPLFPE